MLYLGYTIQNYVVLIRLFFKVDFKIEIIINFLKIKFSELKNDWYRNSSPIPSYSDCIVCLFVCARLLE